jgi:molybdopterin synthase catalytic subunit
MASAVSETVALVALRSDVVSVDEVLAAVGDDGSGGTAVFVGTVRDADDARRVLSLRYDAHPSAETVMAGVVRRIAAAPDVRRVAAVHRVGELAVGDIAVVVAAACGHREAAFIACRRLIDEIKAEVPIWKLQRFADGDDEWVGSP